MFKTLFKKIFEPLDDITLTNISEPRVVLPPVPSTPRPYRPQTLSEYIGQTEAKSVVKSYLAGTQARNKVFPHTLLYGPAGTGKTTLAQIIAHTANKPFKELITSTIKNDLALLMAINSVDGGILLLDEIHGISRDLAESIYSVMEDFKYNGTPIKPFTLIGCTTEIGELLADRRPLVRRFDIQIELDDYQIEDLVTLTKQFKYRAFPDDKIKSSHYYDIAANSRANPSTAVRMLKGCVYLNDDIKTLFKNNKLIKDGYTRKDLQVLQYVSNNEKGVGLQGIASYLGTSQENYLQDIEPYLLRKGLILRAPRGRKITPTGLEKIKELENYGKKNSK